MIWFMTPDQGDAPRGGRKIKKNRVFAVVYTTSITFTSDSTPSSIFNLKF